VRTMEEDLQGLNGYLFYRLGAQLSAAMGLLALSLAVVGLYSVVSYAAAQRTHEIGIRMAMGAESLDVLKIVLVRSVAMIAIGIGIGTVVSFIGARALSSFLIGVSPNDPLTFGAVLLLLLCVALMACLIPAYRATRVDPLVALRYE
jgi:putative ABC transport system permease protein